MLDSNAFDLRRYLHNNAQSTGVWIALWPR